MEKELKPKSAKTEENAQKYSYEELNNICGQLYQQNQKLVQQLRQIDQAFVFQRMNWFLKAVELSDKINDAEFISYCVDEIKTGIVIPEPEERKEETAQD